jgi:hypothetical protein
LELQLRLKALPKDLNQLYEVMILKVDEIYLEEASRVFQLVDKATEQAGDWRRRPAELFSVYTLYLANKQSFNLVDGLKQRRVTEEGILQCCKRMDIVLKTRCGGLLEIQYGKLKTATPRPTMKVSYLHRTVRDFILTGTNWEALLKGTGGRPTGDAFNPNNALLKSLILQFNNCEDSTAEELMDNALTFTHRPQNEKSVPADFEEVFILAWQSALSWVASNCETTSAAARESWGFIIKAFLEHGADPDAYCKGPDGKLCSVSKIITKAFQVGQAVLRAVTIWNDFGARLSDTGTARLRRYQRLKHP